MQEPLNFEAIDKIFEKYNKPYKKKSIFEEVEYDFCEDFKSFFPGQSAISNNAKYQIIQDTLNGDEEFFSKHPYLTDRSSPETIFEAICESQTAEKNTFTDDNPSEVENNNRSVENKSVTLRASFFNHNIYKKIRSKHVLKCCNGFVYIYNKQEGRFRQLGDIALKTLIRDDWDDETKSYR